MHCRKGVGKGSVIPFDTNGCNLNRMTNMVDASGTTKYTYTAGNQLLTEDGPFASDTVTNTYVNRLRSGLSLQQPTGAWTNGFAYDAARRLTNVISPAGAFNYQFVPSGVTHHASRITLPNTSYITNAFDGNARLTGTYLKNSGNTILDSYGYTYNVANQRGTLARTDGSSVNYTYDLIGQLKIADSSVNTEDRGYSYDSAWSLHYRTNNGSLQTFSVDTKNQLTSQPNGSCTYDANGNLTANTWIGYTYDDENCLMSIADTVYYTFRSDFTYDGLSRLRKRIDYQWQVPVPGPGASPSGSLVGTNTVLYVYDGFRVIQTRNTNSTPTVSYTRGTDLSGSLEGAGGIGGLLAWSSGYSGNWTNHNYYFADGNGNITYLLNSSQTRVASYRYDPFGNTFSSSGTLASANVYRFSSKEIHANSGMYYYGFRFYDPNLQRWINRDPIAERGGVNLYEFVGNRPIYSVDKLGLAAPLPIPPFPWPVPPLPEPIPFPPLLCAWGVGAVCSCAIDIGSCIIWPDPGPDPLPLPKRPPKPPQDPICTSPKPKDCRLARSTPERCYYICDWGDGNSVTIWVPNPTGGQCPQTPPEFPGPNTPAPQPIPVPK